MYELSIIQMPLKNTFNHGAFHRTFSDSVILSIVHNGFTGLGECAPRKYVTGEDCNMVADIINQIDINRIVSSIDYSSLDHALDSFLEIKNTSDWNKHLNVTCLLELAILDMIGHYFSISLRDIILRFISPDLIRNDTTQKINTTQVFDLSMNITDFVHKRAPFSFIKVKVTDDLEKNTNILSELRNQVGWTVPISIDANMAWSFETAEKMILAMKPFQIEYYEEPMKARAWDDYRLLRKRTGASILMDESVCTIHDLYMAIKNRSCTAVNIRISKNGGILNAVEMIKICNENNIKFQLGAQVAELGPLTAASRHLAYAVSNYFTYEAGQPDRFFEEYIFEPMPIVDRKTNMVEYHSNIGLGIRKSEVYKKYSEHFKGGKLGEVK